MALKPSWGNAPYYLHHSDGTATQHLIGGRERWALECLMATKGKGCTPIDHPGPRWSAYVFTLRRLGFHIETITETHEGPFAGHHARYVLKDRVTRATEGTA
ncbi:MAG: hypothetical protein U0934_12395 [Pseudotabrizicola sp.]|uniref:winged helix domain-containing protein n=1 Tax=Pseudotabrizicola sp. TaxID=2939647 RepID=UPI0027301302|nr:hypothetical protein [Pseudotabrizicola sp.]MDP2079736.1 hypothetical protein [Pseudotabrizicola sp.]MDZ7574737.1 hypothetical protein [Pseudotabrizicola sp.]